MIYEATFILVVLSVLAYGSLLLVAYFKFKNLQTDVQGSRVQHSVAVVIAARNEEQNIQSLLLALENQECTFQFEVIIVDDHSEDRTVEIAQAHWSKKIQLHIVSNHGTGKKDTITTGVHSTPAEVILVTDADCLPDPEWIQKMAEQFNDPVCAFVGGMIRPHDSEGAIEKALVTETVFLQVVSAGMFAMKSPAMCNGASMGFTRKLFTEVGGFANDFYVSGDDILLMQKAKWQYPLGIRWVKDPNAMVETKVPSSLGDAVKQRQRWLSKIKVYAGSLMTLNGFLFLFMQLQLPFAVVFTVVLGVDDHPFWIGVGLKIIVELLLLSLAASFFRVSNVILWLPVSVVIYCIISLGAVFQMMKGDVEWKGRIWRQGKVR